MKVFKTLSITALLVSLFLFIFFVTINIHPDYLYPWQICTLSSRGEQGDLRACVRLRYHYEHVGNKGKILYWLRKGAALHDTQSKYYIYSFYKAEPSMLSSKEALSYLIDAANNKYSSAENELGELYRDGLLVPLDIKEAQKWFRAAIKNGNWMASYNLSRLLYNNYDDVSILLNALMIIDARITKAQIAGNIDKEGLMLRKEIEGKINRLRR